MFVLIQGTAVHSLALPAEYNFRSIDVQQGLSHNQVHCIYKDSKGFIWIGTISGLNRFDGYNFKIFRHIPSDSTSLNDNRIQDIFEDADGRLWIRTLTSYIVYDPATEKFQQDVTLSGFPLSSLSLIFQDGKKNLWLTGNNNGLYKYFPASDSAVVIIDGDSDGKPEEVINAIHEDGKGDIWVMRSGGRLEKIDGLTHEIVFSSVIIQERFHGRLYITFFIDRDNDFWIYSITNELGLVRFNPTTGSYMHFHKDSPKYNLNNNLVTSVVQDHKGMIWVGTDHGGVNIIDKNDFSTTMLMNNPYDDHSISQNSITYIYADDENIIWLGTFKKGFCYYHPDLFKFKLYQHQPGNPNSLPFNDINCVQEDAAGNLWMGTNGEGLIYFDRKKEIFNSFRHDPANPRSLSNNVIVDMYYDHDNILWLGTFYGGLNRFDGKTFKHFLNPQSLSNDRVWEIFEDSRRNLWIGTLGGGIDIFDRKTETFSHLYPDGTGPDQSPYILEIVGDKKGNVWIGTPNGVECYNISAGTFTHYSSSSSDKNSLSSNIVISILPDSRGLIWFATQEGLTMLRPETKTFKRYYKDDGLPDNSVLAITEDNNGNIWASTTSGISRIQVLEDISGSGFKLIFSNYTKSDGLQGKEFNEGMAFKTKAGELIFGGPDGFNIINPSTLTHNTQPPKVVITDLQIFNRNVEIGEKINGRVLLPNSITNTSQIILKYFEDVITIEFSALNYIHPEKNQYEYMLEGFNREWMKVGSDYRKAIYTNLDPGEYIFRVKASNNDDVWNEKGTELKIIVRPPFWKTKTAIFIYFVLLLSAMFLLRYLILVRERIKVKDEYEKEEAKRKHELDLLKIRFFTNVSHEFRTPLSLIISPLENLLKQASDDKLNAQFKMMYRNARRLLTLVNQLLDFRRMEVQKIHLKPAYGDIVFFVNEIYQTFTDLAEKKNIHFNFKASHEEFFTWFDHDKLEKIIFNLLSNAFKYTPEAKDISIELSITPGQKEPKEKTSDLITLIVSDTGIGIPYENRDRIFESFFQNDTPGNYLSGSSGIGLSLTKEFVQLHNGSINLVSEPGKGSKFTVILPLKYKEVQKPVITPEITEQGVEEIHEQKNVSGKKQALVLLIEDNDDFRFYLKDNLKTYYNIIEANNGGDGVAMAIANLPDLIVSDVMMPVKNGFDLCRELKSNSVTSHIPIILLTARMSDKKKFEGYEKGADDYITKPFSFEMLHSRMNNLIEQRERVRDSFREHFKIEPGEIGITSLDEKLISKAIKLVEDNMSNTDFSVEKLSRELGMSRVHLYKKLTALTGKSPIEFIRIMRLKRAAQLLGKSQQTVSEIAYEVGFNDPRYFSRYFKAEFGVLPSQYSNSKKPDQKER